MLEDLVTPVLAIVVGWGVRKALEFLKVELDTGTYNALVAAIVAFLLAQVFGTQAALLLF